MVLVLVLLPTSPVHLKSQPHKVRRASAPANGETESIIAGPRVRLHLGIEHGRLLLAAGCWLMAAPAGGGGDDDVGGGGPAELVNRRAYR